MEEIGQKFVVMAKTHGKQIATEINNDIFPLAVKNVVEKSPTLIDDTLAGLLVPLIQAELAKLIEKI